MTRSTELRFSGLRSSVALLFAAGSAWVALVGSISADDSIATLAAARVPKDAAFLSSSLRLREQAERFLGSRAVATVRELPSVKRAIKAFEEQASLPGNPLALVSVFLELPENRQAVEVLADLVSNDSFVYGEPSCVTLIDLFKKLQTANQVAGVMRRVRGRSGGDGPGIELDIDLGDGADKDADKDDGARLPPRRGLRVRPVLLRAVAAEPPALDDVPADELAGRLIVATLVDNVEQIVVPDVVWGFKVGKKDAAATQLKRLEGVLKLAVTAVPELAKSLDRQEVAGHEFVTFTVTGEMVPWDDLDVGRLAEESADFEKVLDRLRSLRLVIAVGLIDDRVILSIGDSLDHLKKLAATEPADGLLTTLPFRPLVDVAGEKLTGISYLSEPLARVVNPSVDYLRQLATMSGRLAKSAGVPDAKEDVRKLLLKIADDSEKRLPVAGPWMSYAFLGETGYEGAAWDWSKNVPLDGGKQLSLLEHAGGSPLAAAVIRAKNDPTQFDEIVSWIDGARGIVEKGLEDGGRLEFGRFVKTFGPLVSKLAEIVRTKLLPSLADGQVGFVLDAKSRVKRLHEDLPAAAEPLPLAEPAIVLGVSDPKGFQDGINDLFDLADELIDTVRRFSPNSVPEGYRIPDPERKKTEAGTIWSFAIPKSGLDEQIRPSIALGADAVAFALVSAQAERLLAKKPLKTPVESGAFEKPLAVAAAFDNAGLVAAIEPWVAYGLRYASVWRRDGDVDADETLDAADEDESTKDILAQTRVVFDVLKCFRGAAAETSVEKDARVTRWRNSIRDLPEAAAK